MKMLFTVDTKQIKTHLFPVKRATDFKSYTIKNNTMYWNDVYSVEKKISGEETVYIASDSPPSRLIGPVLENIMV